MRILWNLAIASSAAVICTACSFSAPTLQETRELETPIADGGRFEIDAGAGSLTLTGDDTADAIRVLAEIYQTAANDDYTLTLELQDGNRARLVADAATSLGGGSDRIDLSITVPRRLGVTIVDGSGSLRVESLIGDVDIEDGSGSIRVSDIQGGVVLDDGSGSIVVTDIAGDVSIDDGSGSISVTNVGGKVTVSDGSGSIDVDGAGDFELVDDGSGSVSTRNVRNRNAGGE
ncbi:MAG: hypothetical protein CMP07_10085 [Xanthomonadales bacterium]|nr:hypothetical protein [Xanthomonadales bacterium]|tara:strand:- start:61 stop:756 length:696 start_codon:yes stop_codon:yes gene_type:complete